MAPSPSTNVELKVRVDNLEDVRVRAVAMGARDAGILKQKDTFFGAHHARLKLRELGDGEAELISYQRRDVPEARSSYYCISKVVDAPALSRVLSHALGTMQVVTKKRHLFLYKNTRIHLDRVEGLGTFVELETVVTDQTEIEAHEELRAVVHGLQLDWARAVSVPYAELLAASDVNTASGARSTARAP